MKPNGIRRLSAFAAVCTVLSFLFLIPCAARDGIYWPVPGHESISQGYHNESAIDISDREINGAPVIAAEGGTVERVYTCEEQHFGSRVGCSGMGTGLIIRGDDGKYYTYAHMQGGTLPDGIAVGDRVEAGQRIGLVGCTGNASDPHLHFGITIGSLWGNGTVNPENLYYRKVKPVVFGRCRIQTPSPFRTCAVCPAEGEKIGEVGYYLFCGKTETKVPVRTYPTPRTVREIGAVLYDAARSDLAPDTEYRIQFYAVSDGVEFTAEPVTFRTPPSVGQITKRALRSGAQKISAALTDAVRTLFFRLLFPFSN